MAKSIWKNVVATKEKELIILLSLDTVVSCFQDLFVTTHYVLVSGPPGITLAQYTESGINQLTSLPRQNFSIIDSSPTTLAGLPAHTVTHIFTEDGINSELMQTWVIDNTTDTAYVITSGSTVEEFNDGLPVLRGMTDSFQVESSDLS